ncbi:uncharacterized protein F5891DRAFT_1193475 [Suillus fuscotomentosus]|uniref:SAP domain-containing protein n=1 Tax=Suillus fuscotomentosus TaxID=1912939 RepID=A0AAD4HGW0_9AGAM|nr:uncharacterized protein F5891DRAFT_1193475 [Suillus fuscotomentosus]KAG1896037.1 hypothetical protein F5891DRAFT_1193475 [Suillus fuscotomentosus]
MPAAEIICLPELGKTLGVNKQPQTVEFVIQQDTTVKMLREKLKEYGLQTTGKKADLIERLREYAADDTSWRLLFQPARKGARGSYTGRRTAKLSTQRITSQFGEHELTLVQHRSKQGIGRVVQSLTPADVDNNDAWAADALQVVGTQRPAAQSANMLLSATEQPTLFAPQFSAHTNLLPAGTTYPAHKLTTETKPEPALQALGTHRLEDTLIERVNNLEMGISNQIAHKIAPLLRTSFDAFGTGITQQPLRPAHPHPHTTSMQLSSAPAQPFTTPTPAAQMAIPTQSIPPSNLSILQLEGRELAFNKTMVMPPPAVRFSTDISALFREWHQSMYLVVNRNGIPIKFWGDVYKKCTGQNSKAWALRKVQWGQWKFIMEECLRFASDDAFWTAWTDANGQHIRYTKLCDTLQRQRMARDT